jgi:hypothetical protein
LGIVHLFSLHHWYIGKFLFIFWVFNLQQPSAWAIVYTVSLLYIQAYYMQF